MRLNPQMLLYVGGALIGFLVFILLLICFSNSISKLFSDIPGAAVNSSAIELLSTPPSLLPIHESHAPQDLGFAPFEKIVMVGFCVICLVSFLVMRLQERKRRLQERQAQLDRARFNEAAHMVNIALIKAGARPSTEVCGSYPTTMQEVLELLPNLVWERHLLADAAVTIERNPSHFLVYKGRVMTCDTYQWALERESEKEKEELEEKKRWQANEPRRDAYLDGQVQ
jgi:hypothetical protein